MKKFFVTSFVSILTVLVTALVPATTYAAGSASMALSGSGSRTVGGVFRVNIVENSGADPVNVIQADLNYDTSKLQLIGGGCSSAFEITAPGGSGITCGTTAPKTGAQAVGFANFKVKAAGTGAVSIASSSHIYRSTDNADVWNGAANGVSFGFVNPVPVAPAPVAATPAPAPVTKPATTKKAAPAPVASQPAKSGLSAWIYVPLGLIAAAAGIAYVFRKEFGKATVGLRKAFPRS